MREIKYGSRVRYRYLNKGKALYGYVGYITITFDALSVQMDDGTRLVRKMSSWDIINEK